jgi:hypothetical protein
VLFRNDDIATGFLEERGGRNVAIVLKFAFLAMGRAESVVLNK